MAISRFERASRRSSLIGKRPCLRTRIISVPTAPTPTTATVYSFTLPSPFPFSPLFALSPGDRPQGRDEPCPYRPRLRIPRRAVRCRSIQQILEPVDQSLEPAHPLAGHHDPGHEAGAVDRVVTQRQRLPDTAKDDLLVCHIAGQADAVDADAVKVAAPAAGQLDLLVRAGQPLGSAGGPDHLGRLEGGAGGSIHLLLVMQ